MDLFDYLLTRAGVNPHHRYGPSHGAPLSMWLALGGVISLAAGVLGLTSCLD